MKILKLIHPFLFLIAPFGLVADESVEPGLSYTLKIGERSYQISENEPFEIEAVSEKSKAQLVADSHRIFTYQSIEFEYPAHFVFEADVSDATSKSWTLSGNDCTVMILSMAVQMSATEFGAELAEQFGKKNTKISDVELQLGKTKYNGALLETTVAGTRMTMDILTLSASKGASKLLTIQDALGEDGKHSEEYEVILEKLRETFSEKDAGKSK